MAKPRHIPVPQDRHDNPLKYLSNADIQAVVSRLHEAASSLLSVHRLAFDAGDIDDDEFYLVAIRELVRGAFRGLDACIVRLDGDFGIGNFSNEFDDEEEVATAQDA